MTCCLRIQKCITGKAAIYACCAPAVHLLCTCCAPAVQGHIGLAVSVTLSFMSLHIKKPQSHVVNSGAKVIRGTTQIQEQVLLLLTDAGR